MENIFTKYDNDIVRCQTKTHYPTSTFNLNSVNKQTVFRIDGIDSFLNIKQAKFDISGTLTKVDGTPYEDGTSIALVDNFVGFLFPHIEVKKHGRLLCELDNTGRSGLINGYVSYSDKNFNSGFTSFPKKSGNFHFIGLLSEMGLGFFQDIQFPVYKGGFEISFIRGNSDDCIFRWKPSSTTNVPDPASLKINEFLLRIPIVEYADIPKIKLINELKLLSDKNQYRFIFKTLQCVEERNLTGKSFTKDITNSYRSLRNPLFAMVAFQTNKLDSQTVDSSKFDHCKVKNIYFEINGRKYPEELQNFDQSEGKIALVYDMYQDYKRIFGDNKPMYLTYHDFLSRYVYCIDLSRQPLCISETRHNIILHVDFQDNVTTNTICYINIVSSSDFSYNITQNLITEIID